MDRAEAMTVVTHGELTLIHLWLGALTWKLSPFTSVCFYLFAAIHLVLAGRYILTGKQ